MTPRHLMRGAFVLCLAIAMFMLLTSFAWHPDVVRAL